MDIPAIGNPFEEKGYGQLCLCMVKLVRFEKEQVTHGLGQYRCHGLTLLGSIDLAVTSLLANQLIASESGRTHDQRLCAAGQSEFFVYKCLVSPDIYFTVLYCCRQLTVVPAIFVFRLVDSILSSSLHIVH